LIAKRENLIVIASKAPKLRRTSANVALIEVLLFLNYPSRKV